MTASFANDVRASQFWTHDRRLAVIASLLAACILSTALHFAHNYIEIEHYPASDFVSNSTIRLGIVTLWPLLTAAGIVGLSLYARRRYVAAYPLLAAYSLLGIATLGHFTEGNPHIPAFWYATIFTDGVLGFAILAFAHWSAITSRREGAET